MGPREAPTSKGSIRASVVVALAGDMAIASCKGLVAGVTGSPAMMAEAVHSCADCLSSAFLVVGERARRKPPDREHPVGHGREAYFWTLIAAVSSFASGGAVSVYEGVAHLLRPRPLDHSAWSFVVLATNAALDAWAAVAAYLEIRRRRRGQPPRGVWEAFRSSKDLATYAVLFGSVAGLLGVLIATVGIVASWLARSPYPDAAASVAIGALLAIVALLVARETRGLLIGESADPRVEQQIRRIAESCADVEEVLQVLTLYTGPNDVFLAMDVRFRAALTASKMVDVIDAIEQRIRERYPDIKRIFIEADRLIEAKR